MTEITVQLPDKLFAIVERTARERGISIEEFIRQCVEQVLAEWPLNNRRLPMSP